MPTKNELKKLLREAEMRGWVFDTGGKHIKGKHPNGQRATVSVSPSDHRALQNIKRDLKVRP